MTEENSDVLDTESEKNEEIENQEVKLDNQEVNNDNEVTTDAEVPNSEEQPQSKSQNTKQRLRRKLREEQAEKSRILAENEKIRKDLEELSAKVDPLINPPPQRPNRVDFESEEDYEDSLFDWRDKINSRQNANQKVTPDIQTQDVAPLNVSDEAQENWLNQMDLALDKYDDFEDVLVSIPKESVTDSMTLTIMESSKAGEIAYFLGNNHAEAARIARLSIANQVREIDKLGAKFKTTTGAPDPISSVQHKGEFSDKVNDPMLEGATFE